MMDATMAKLQEMLAQWCEATDQHDAHVRDAFPPLTFKPEEWAYVSAKVQTIKWSEVSDPTDWRTAEQRHADDIMSAVRDIARGG